ncbi:MAG: hypothetical protein C5S38_03210 [Candidatus Methanophagaceae archaeon]|nr:MAG: hypothetical protein C5S38_03210 [Methanophagales archaeon]
MPPKIMKSTPTSLAFLTATSINSGVSVIKGITGSKNIPHAIPSFLKTASVFNRSVGDGTPGSKIALRSSSTDEKLKLTIVLFFSFIRFRMSISL